VPEGFYELGRQTMFQPNAFMQALHMLAIHGIMDVPFGRDDFRLLKAKGYVEREKMVSAKLDRYRITELGRQEDKRHARYFNR
jgi:hypothetical protein